MYEQVGTQDIGLPRPSSDDREAWKTYWERQGQSWRTEPEIEVERQDYLAKRRAMTPDVKLGVYPFKDIKLSRADVEWLLAMHENGRGPIYYSNESQRHRIGVDLRGADLRRIHLQNLPLACTLGDVTWREWLDLTEEQHTLAAVHFEGADLKGVHLEGASLWATHWAGANHREVHLQKAHLDQRVVLVNDQQIGPRLIDAHLDDVNLAQMRWSQVTMLGDEYKARQKVREGKAKDKTTQLEEYEEAVRANRQLALALQAQGLNEDAARFSYRAQVLQRKVFWLQGIATGGQYLFSLFLALLTGYGYRMWRIVVVYALANVVFASLYYSLGLGHPPHLTWIQALVVSITAFHGRVFSTPFPPDSPQVTVTAFEAATGLIFEGTFIAMLTQRFFGK